jgi:parallel beta-helix repeat protein
VIGVAIRNFGSGRDNDGEAQIRVGAFANATIGKGLIGNRPDASRPTKRRHRDGIRVVGRDNGRIYANLIGYSGGNGIALRSGADGWTIDGNEIRFNSLNASDLQGILVDSSAGVRIAGNWITDQRGEGIDVLNPTGAATIASNTIQRNGSGGS